MSIRRASDDPSKEAHGLYMVEKHEMAQVIGKWHLGHVKYGLTFCGFRIRIKYKLIKRQSMIRQRRKLKHLLAHDDHDGWRRSVLSWMGHIRHGDGQNGLKHLGLAAPC